MSSWLIVFCYCFIAYGACNVIAYGSGPFKIFERLRGFTMGINEHLGSLFGCMMCLPANFGWICSLVNYFFVPIAFTPFNIIFAGMPHTWWMILLLILCDGAFTTGVVWLIHNVELFFENLGGGGVSNNIENEDEIIEIHE